MQLSKTFRYIFIFFMISSFIVGCKKDDDDDPTPVIPNEEELITTVIYTLTDDTTGTTYEFRFTDLDGDGSNAPVVTSDSIPANSKFTAKVEFLNETETPAEDITEEIMEEDTEHQLFFTVTGANYTIEYSDTDPDGNPLGLETAVTSGATGNGSLSIVLRHEPNKNAPGVSDGDITNAGGETDIEVDFPLNIRD